MPPIAPFARPARPTRAELPPASGRDEGAGLRLRIATRRTPLRIAGQQRHVLLWTDSVSTAARQAAQGCAAARELDRSLAPLCATLELAYAVVLIERQSGQLTLVAGYKNTYPLYFSCDAGQVAIADSLPCATPADRLHHLDQEGFADFIARAVVAGPFELSTDTTTLDRRWQTVPPGQRLTLDRHGRLLSRGVADRLFAGVHTAVPSVAEASEALREAVDGHLLGLAARATLASEFSGGIDSSIVRARCLARLADRYRGGVNCRFPYPEFARETQMQAAVLAHAPGPVAAIDHRGFLPFAGLVSLPWHGAPTLASTAWGAFASAARAARSVGATVLLNGHGGDTLFRWHPAEPLRYRLPDDLARWLGPRLRQQVAARAAAIAAGLNAAPGEDVGGLWHPGMFDPANPTTLVRSGVPGMDYVSGLATRATLRAAARLWLAAPRRAPSVQKSFAHVAFAADLPDALWHRPGKVDHLGIVYRGAIAARAELLSLAGRSAGVLDALGVRDGVVGQAADAASRGIDSGNPMLSIIMSVLLWAGQPQRTQQAAPTMVYDFNSATFEETGGEPARTTDPANTSHPHLSTIED